MKLTELPLRSDGTDSKLWISLDDFVIYCKSIDFENGILKRSRIKRFIESRNSSHVKSINGIECVCTFSVLRFVFNYSEQFDDFYSIANSLNKHYFQQNENCDKTTTTTIVELYRLIPDLLSINRTFDHSFLVEPLWIHHENKHLFSNEQWIKICLFEEHFRNYVSDDLSYNTFEKRLEYFKYLESATDLSACLSNNGKKTIKRRKHRMSAFSSTEEGILRLQSGMKHRVHFVESEIQVELRKLFNTEVDIEVVCVRCLCPNIFDDGISTIDIIISGSQTDLLIENDLATTLILNKVNRHHCVQVHWLLFLENDTFSSYLQNDGQIARYHLYDDIRLKVLEDSIIYIKVVHEDNIIHDELSFGELDELCPTCFENNLPRLLSLNGFQLLREWHMDVPLEIQIIFGAFINNSSLSKNSDVTKFLGRKYERLYLIYDMMLNNMNKNYFGILSQKITDELLINYHSISSIFKVTSIYGFTASLEFAEKSLISKTLEDKLYYQTYIKTYPLTYNSICGEITQMVSLRNCYLILMLDNLVRLKYHSDPDPGEHRSKQMCMLPITLQGVPRDNEVVETWHNQEICDGSQICPCMRPNTFAADEAFDIVVNLLPREEECYGRVINVFRWGNQHLFKVIMDTTRDCSKVVWLRNFLQDAVHQPHIKHSSSENIVDARVENEGAEYNIHILDEETVTDTEVVSLHELLPDINQDLHNSSSDSELLAKNLENPELEISMEQMKLNDSVDTQQEPIILTMFGLNKFCPPPLLEKHPSPAIGRDDDINKLREVLDDILIKTCLDSRLCRESVSFDRILFGPDNKIGINLLKLMKENKKYTKFLPEFPLLHLRKSKVNTLFSAYKHCGLIELLMVMRDETTSEWTKLITAEHIDVATRHVRRIAQGIQLALSLKFIQTLSSAEAEMCLSDILDSSACEVSEKFNISYQSFLDSMNNTNATFALHYDMMVHCNEVVAVKLAERLGGQDGYNILLGAVKSSLWFSFLNGASSYAPYCTRLLAEHYTAGSFHQNQKKCLFSTPIGNSTVNFACDTKREMDHKDALKGFRSGCSQESAVRRMSLIDSFNSSKNELRENANVKEVSWYFTETDMSHIFRIAEVILRRNGLSSTLCETPHNVYASKQQSLSCEVLDKKSKTTGLYLTKRFMCKDMLFGLKEVNCPSLEDIESPSNLKARLRKNVGVTIKRSVIKQTNIQKSDREVKESKRTKLISSILKQTHHLSSDMNMCQAIVKPDCSKPKIQKSVAIKQALINVLTVCDSVQYKNCIIDYEISMPEWMKNGKLVTIEFAGVKFKTKAFSGNQYIKYVQNAILSPLILQMPMLDRIILCEEKYSFTPDDFKAATRQQRKKPSTVSIAHLKTNDDILSKDTFQRDAIRGTDMGKSLISNYLAANVHCLRLPRAITLDIDSELRLNCECNGACNCEKCAIPIRCQFMEKYSTPRVYDLIDIKQRKGEAEMAQVDWLVDCADTLKPDDEVVSFVTSGDIDAVVIHLFAVSSRWPRYHDGKLKNTVYVILQKPSKKYDVYNITLILHILEDYFGSKDIGVKVAVALCIGGNDFIPKFKGISHDKVLNTYLFKDQFCSLLLSPSLKIQPLVYEDFVKFLFCPKSLDPQCSTADEVRNNTRVRKRISQKTILTEGMKLSSADSWMPPSSVLHRLSNLIQLQIQYLQTAGDHSAPLPNFMSLPCLRKTATGEIEYDFGTEASMPIDEVLFLSELRKRPNQETPQKGKRKKRQMTSTPKKGQ